jgi:hypothetical protein
MKKKVQHVSKFTSALRSYLLELRTDGREVTKLSDLDFWELRHLIDLTDDDDMSLMIKQIYQILTELEREKK